MTITLITGASSGIGAATARLLGSRGHKVVLVARREKLLQEVAHDIRRLGGVAHVLVLDLTDPSHCQRAVPETIKRCGGLDVLINCAGIAGGSSVDTPPELVHEILTTNLIAPIHLMRDVVNVFSDQGGGVIVNVGSVAGEIGVRGIYSASKFGLRGMSDSVRREVRRKRIIVSLVEPGQIEDSRSTKNTLLTVRPEVVAAYIEKAMQRSYPRLVVPQRALLVTVLARLFPKVVDVITAQTARVSKI